MKKKLQPIGLTLFTIFTVWFCLGDAANVYGQITLTSEEPVTVAFYEGVQPQSDQRFHYFSRDNFQSILSENLRSVSAGIENEIYLTGSGGAVFPGISDMINVPGMPVTLFSLVSQSADDFDELEFVFDFIAMDEPPSGTHSIRLIYRKNEGRWTDVPGGRLHLSSFQSEEEQATVSVQLSMNDVYLSADDILDFAWISEQDIPGNFSIYLQQFQIMPVVFHPSQMERGQLIITEIMPLSDVDGHRLEYVEIYNPSENPLSLKGLTIETESGSVIIEKDFILPGYQMGIIANADLSELEQVTNSYFYNDKILPDENGRINLTIDGSLIASATYGSSENNRSFELTESGHATDGYTSMQHLVTSSRNFLGLLWGSPGEFGRTLPLYTKEFTEPGVYLLSVPGKLKGEGSQYRDLEFFTLDGVKVAASEIQPYEPVIMVKENSEQSILIADGINLTGHQSELFTSEHGNFQFLIPTNPAHYDLGGTLLGNRELIPPVYGKWNSRLHKFDLVTPSAITEGDSWSPLVTTHIKNDVPNQRRSSVQSRQNEKDLWLFSLSESENRRSAAFDEIAVGFSENNVFTDGVPKAVINNDRVNNPTSYPALYVSSSEAISRANSFIQLGTSLSDRKEIVIGIDKKNLNNQIQAEIRWNLPDIIPEEWTLTLTDPATGSEIDMRQQDYYRFRIHPSERREMPDNESVYFQGVLPDQVHEFIISMTPPMLIEQRETEQEIPGNIELRQNYPNPFNPTTNITFFLPEQRQVKLGIYNIVGQQVASLIEDNQQLQAGEHSIVWDASNSPSGIYIVQLESGNRTLTRKITLVK